ncbi:MAG: energy transducer TonB [Muribaculaceae bacterium]|nr:energy transducer TonB [Muribaculaceae bacterium]
MHRLLFLIISTFTLGLTALESHGQTCRVSVGKSGSGESGYIEVYEYDFVNEKPSFPGGDRLMMSYINENRQYPREAYRQGIQGKVICSFVVAADGSIEHVKVLRGVERSLNQEAVRVLSSMPDWTPGRHEGHRVPVRVVRSVAFRK